MKVVHHLCGGYYLLQHNGKYYFDVNSGRGAVGFSISIALGEEQEASYMRNGTRYLKELAEFVHQEQITYLELQVDQDINKAMRKAITQLIKENIAGN